MMSKCFREGFKYVFTKKKFLKDVGYRRYMGTYTSTTLQALKNSLILHRRYMGTYTKPWVDVCNGQVVKAIGSLEGYVGTENIGNEIVHYSVIPQWCKCIGKQK